jgi:TusA-related sulfurtransferase
VVKAANALKTLALNQILEVRATDPGAVPDMEALARQTGQEILGVRQEAEEVRILIRRLR